ncbi:MAG: RNA polymerase factor sigma-32 [Polyangiaceae bacterium]|nr:RNA polymerase factor sigma-32 [Polyangiaceae bacterium]
MAARKKKSESKAKAPSAEHDPEAGDESEEAGEGGEGGDDELVGEVSEDAFVDTTAEVVDDAPATSGEDERGLSLARLDPMTIYMREVQRHPLLTAEQAHELAVRYAETQDVDAAARLVTANLRLVVKIAYEYRRAYRNMMDLVQEGNIGLMQAVKRYDPYRGVKLSSYAAWWIRAYILRFILNNWRMVKIGTTQAQRKLFFNLSKEKQKLTAMGIEPTHAEIAKRLDVEEQEVVEMDRRLSRADASLDAQVGESDGKPTTRMDLLPATAAGPDESAESSEIQELLKVHLAEFRTTLKDKDVAIFDKRLVADEPLTLQQLGDEFGVSRERVRQLEARLTGKLRIFLTERLGDAVGVSGG